MIYAMCFVGGFATFLVFALFMDLWLENRDSQENQAVEQRLREFQKLEDDLMCKLEADRAAQE